MEEVEDHQEDLLRERLRRLSTERLRVLLRKVQAALHRAKC